jgi:hypothetical protein
MTHPRAPPEYWRIHLTLSERPHHVKNTRAAHLAGCAALNSFLPSGRERFTIIMIPDEPLNFNHFDASGTFDNQEVRLRRLFQQVATPTLEIGRHLLSVCPVCKQPWYKAGRHEYPRLTPEQLVFLGALLQVDIQALYLLPRAFCTICSALHLGGMFSAEGYSRHRGYRFLWESVSPPRIQLLALVCLGEELTLDALVQMIPERFAEPLGEMRSVLAWLEMCPSPEAVQTLSDEQSQYLVQVQETVCASRKKDAGYGQHVPQSGPLAYKSTSTERFKTANPCMMSVPKCIPHICSVYPQ